MCVESNKVLVLLPNLTHNSDYLRFTFAQRYQIEACMGLQILSYYIGLYLGVLYHLYSGVSVRTLR